MGNPVILNVSRPRVLRQYYGCDLCYKSHDIITRVTYGYGSKRNSVGTDPNKFVTKPLDYNMVYMASYIRICLCRYATELNLSSPDLVHELDSCVILDYYSHTNLKKSLAWVIIVIIHKIYKANIQDAQTRRWKTLQ